MSNLFDGLPAILETEAFDTLFANPSLTIERIVSRGHSSPASGWYDQEQGEWVIVLQGDAILEFADGTTTRLIPGSYVNIPAHTQHRVSWTDPTQDTIWLAVFYPDAGV